MTNDSTTPARIEALFAVPLAVFRLPQPERLCADLRDLFLEREHQGERYRNEIKRATQGEAVFESKFDLFTWSERPVQALRQLCHSSLLSLLKNLQAIGDDIEFEYHAWFHVTRNGGFQGLHNHQNASWSGIFCVDPGDEDAEHPKSGVVRFHDARAFADMYSDAANRNMGVPFNCGVYEVRHEVGKLVIFPSYLFHEVFPYVGKKPRIIVAFNSWAKRRG